MKLIHKIFLLPFLFISLLCLTSCTKEDKVLEFDEAHPFYDDLAMVKINDLYGFIDENLNVVIPTVYDDAGMFIDNKCVVRKDGYYGIINSSNEVLLPLEYEAVRSTSNGNLYLKKDDKWGVMDSSFNLITPFEYDNIENSLGDYLTVFKDGKCGLLNENGELIVDNNYSSIHASHFNVNNKITTIFITEIEMKYGYIYPEKNIELEPIYQSIHSIYSYEILLTKENNKYGFINLAKGITVEPIYDNDIDFSMDGLAPVSENGIYKYINTEGVDVITDLNITDAYPFSDGLALIKVEDGYRYIDTSGNTIIPGPFTKAETFNYGYAIVEKDNNSGVINTKGEYIFEPNYRNIQINHTLNIKDTTFLASYPDGTSYNTACFDYEGNLLFDTVYDRIELYGYVGGYYGIVIDNGKYGCINDRGVEIIPAKYTQLLPTYTRDNLFFIAMNSDFKHGVMDISGAEILPFDYERIQMLSDIFIIKADDKYGFYNPKNKVLTKPIYDEIYSYDDKNIIVKQNDKYIYLNNEGVPIK